MTIDYMYTLLLDEYIENSLLLEGCPVTVFYARILEQSMYGQIVWSPFPPLTTFFVGGGGGYQQKKGGGFSGPKDGQPYLTIPYTRFSWNIIS